MNDGGPAFPGGISAALKATDDTPPTQIGMSLRDYFAGRCLTAYVHSLEQGIPEGGCEMPTKELVAQVCYEYADAMLRERAKTQPTA